MGGSPTLRLLILVGLAAGYLASLLSGGGHKARNMAIGVAAALATPFVLAALGVGILAAGGLLVILIVALVGAGVVLAIARAVFGSR